MRVFEVALCVALSATLLGCPSPHSVPESDGGGEIVVLLPYPADGGIVEWDGWAGEFVTDYCVQCHNPAANCSGSGCHPAAGALPDFRLHSTVAGFAPMIRCGISVAQDPSWQCGTTTPEEFPVVGGSNPLPTDEQRGIMIGWVDAGCP